MSDTWEPQFSPWRHGGYYVDNIRYPSGAVGCVARCEGGKWAIACPEGGTWDLRFQTRVEAAKAEYAFVEGLKSGMRVSE